MTGRGPLLIAYMAEISFQGIQKSYLLQKHEFKKKTKEEIKKLKAELKTAATSQHRQKLEQDIENKKSSLAEVKPEDLQIDIIRDFDLEIKDKEFVVFVGPSGCGKSTVLRMLAGLEEITAGDISISGKRVNDTAPKDRDIAFVFQSYALYPHLTIFDNIAFGLRIRKMPEPEIQKRVHEAAEKLQLIEQLHKKPKQLSGGQRQRVAMGRAIVREPSAFLFDEPLSNLDAKLRQEMRVTIKKLTAQLNTTTVYVTHDQIEAMTLADKIVVLNRLEPGTERNIQQVGAPLEIYYNPYNTFVAGFIGTPTINLLEGSLKREADKWFFEKGEIRIMLPSDKNDMLTRYGKDRLTIGIRPQDFEEASVAGSAPEGATVSGVCDVTENLGAEIHAQVKVGSDTLAASVNSLSKLQMGQKTQLVVNTSQVHLFDIDTGINLNRGL